MLFILLEVEPDFSVTLGIDRRNLLIDRHLRRLQHTQHARPATAQGGHDPSLSEISCLTTLRLFLRFSNFLRFFVLPRGARVPP